MGKKDATKKIYYSTIKIKDTEDDREINQARSKPDIVNRHVRTARTFVQHYNSTQFCSRDSFLNIPLPPDRHHISDVDKWSQGAKLK